MRGHIGFKIPRVPPVDVLVTFLSTDLLVFDVTVDNEARVSHITTDLLAFDATVDNEARVSHITTDLLAFNPAQ